MFKMRAWVCADDKYVGRLDYISPSGRFVVIRGVRGHSWPLYWTNSFRYATLAEVLKEKACSK